MKRRRDTVIAEMACGFLIGSGLIRLINGDGFPGGVALVLGACLLTALWVPKGDR